jgi:hypothetical protein
VGSFSISMPLDKANKEKEVRLLHLDHVQKSLLGDIIHNFVRGVQIDVRDVVGVFKAYVLKLLELAESGEKTFCDINGSVTTECNNYIKKFTDALYICSKQQIHHHKIFSAASIKDILSKMFLSKQYATHYLNELAYIVQYETYVLLETNNDKVKDYVQDLEHFYLTSLATVNPYMAKKLFVEHITDMIHSHNSHTASDILHLISKYTSYLGKSPPSHHMIEKLIHQYGDADERPESGALYTTKIEIFKILQ